MTNWLQKYFSFCLFDLPCLLLSLSTPRDILHPRLPQEVAPLGRDRDRESIPAARTHLWLGFYLYIPTLFLRCFHIKMNKKYSAKLQIIIFNYLVEAQIFSLKTQKQHRPRLLVLMVSVSFLVTPGSVLLFETSQSAGCCIWYLLTLQVCDTGTRTSQN